MSFYKLKYLKYKNKYLELKKISDIQTGGTNNITGIKGNRNRNDDNDNDDNDNDNDNDDNDNDNVTKKHKSVEQKKELILITSGVELGKGAYKIANGVIKQIHFINTGEKARLKEGFFEISTDIDENKLVIVKFKEKFKIDSSKDKIFDEFRSQYKYSNLIHPIAPKIYKIRIDNGEEFHPVDLEKNINKIDKNKEHQMYILEERCGKSIIYLLNNKLLTVNELFKQLIELIDNFILQQILYLDFKSGNTCTLTDNYGKLLAIRGLDFDHKFIIKFKDIPGYELLNLKEIEKHTKTFMIIIFFAILINSAQYYKIEGHVNQIRILLHNDTYLNYSTDLNDMLKFFSSIYCNVEKYIEKIKTNYLITDEKYENRKNIYHLKKTCRQESYIFNINKSKNFKDYTCVIGSKDNKFETNIKNISLSANILNPIEMLWYYITGEEIDCVHIDVNILRDKINKLISPPILKSILKPYIPPSIIQPIMQQTSTEIDMDIDTTQTETLPIDITQPTTVCPAPNNNSCIIS
jgi:hypothetical protein